MTTPLGSLLSTSFQRCQQRLQPLALGVLLFGSLVAIVSTVANQRIEGHIMEGMRSLGVDQGRMMELQKKIQSGEEGVIEETMAEMNTMMGGVDSMSDDERNAMFQREGMAMMFRVLPVMSVGAFAWAVISLLATAYYLFFAVGKGKDAVEILSNSLHSVIPLLGVWIWSFLRSFAWIPLVGIIPAVILGPRFVLAPVILVTQNKCVTGSVSESYEKTRGFWGKIIGNMLVLCLILLVISWAISLVTLPIALTSRVLSIWIHSVVQQGTMAYGMMFLVLLTKTIVEQAPGVVKKK
ncbi:MAG: hypothetical protein Greene101449_260 [Candidatus Peregrinibacteria bacterium Greene1014_49]|nr:MAG: hypothetical protein Greene101449_260 [Candidatus Peregrinibacteria bacterium Greene1014_49]